MQPSRFSVTNEGLTVEKSSEDTLTYGVTAKPRGESEWPTEQTTFAVRVDAIPCLWLAPRGKACGASRR